MKKKLIIECNIDISFSLQCKIIEEYSTQNQFIKNIEKFWGLSYNNYELKETLKYPQQIELDNHSQEYWVTCKKNKDSFKLLIRYK